MILQMKSRQNMIQNNAKKSRRGEKIKQKEGLGGRKNNIANENKLQQRKIYC